MMEMVSMELLLVLGTLLWRPRFASTFKPQHQPNASGEATGHIQSLDKIFSMLQLLLGRPFGSSIQVEIYNPSSQPLSTLRHRSIK